MTHVCRAKMSKKGFLYGVRYASHTSRAGARVARDQGGGYRPKQMRTKVSEGS